jgi:hypothetical protein
VVCIFNTKKTQFFVPKGVSINALDFEVIVVTFINSLISFISGIQFSFNVGTENLVLQLASVS